LTSSPQQDRVVVTGIGLVTPFAAGREASWRSIRNGESAARWVDLPLDDKSGTCATFRAAGAPAHPLPSDFGSEEPIVAMALCAAEEAWSDAGLTGSHLDPARCGCVVGTSKGGLRSFARAFANDAAIPRAWPLFLPDAPARAVSERFRVQGPMLCPVAACATGLASLNRGVDLIRDGTCDAVLAGSTEASFIPAVVASFQRLGVLARGFEDPRSACRPYDRRRNGFLIGEGAAVLVLESLSRARDRGAAIYGEWLAGGSLADAAGLTHLDETGEGLARLIHDVLARSGLTPDQIDYVNLHGTATRENDAVETRGLRLAFGAAADRLCGSSLKGAIGHLLGAAGSVETACTFLALRDGVIPPTVNLERPSAECDLDYTPQFARARRSRHALKLSLGFGGHLTAAVLAAPDS
jgi:3-oxoacyl-[acyl-carrier-protein] synthase II